MATTVIEKYKGTADDLLYNILLKIGGTVNDIKQKYRDTTDDLLYAILEKLDGVVSIDPGDGSFPLPDFIATISLTSTNPQVVNIGSYPGADDIFTALVVAPGAWNDQTVNSSHFAGEKYYVSGNSDDLILKIRL